jgi:hypothetical protein
MFRFMKCKAVAGILVIAAISTPTASARPIDLAPASAGDVSGAVVDYSRADGPSPRPVSVVAPASGGASSSNGFDWGDAAIGAGSMLALLGLGTGAALVARRGRERGQPATTS